jgi:hypothetical protein
MNTIADIAAEGAARGLEFLLVGGHAVWAFGFQRNTDDIDFLVRKDQVSQWIELLLARGYRVFELNNNFVQLSPPPSEPAFDLLIADNSTWQTLHATRVEHPSVGPGVASPSPLHLIAMKLHAFKNSPRWRSKDWIDIGELIRRCKIDVHSAEFRDIVVRYAGRETYERLAQENSHA